MAMVYCNYAGNEYRIHDNAYSALLDVSSLHCNQANTDHQARVDAYKIAVLLRYKLVADLVRPIVDFAGLYNPQTSISDQYQVVRSGNSPAICLRSEQISCRARAKVPVREVTFTIIAKGQGSGAWPGSGEWTWFAAAVMRPGEEDVVGERIITRNSLTPGGFGTHQVTWSSDSADEDEARWVRSLGVGDRVVVRGHAKHSGWSNFVKFVGVTVSTVVIVR